VVISVVMYAEHNHIVRARRQSEGAGQGEGAVTAVWDRFRTLAAMK
jgi:hypothetical protein